jgi:hypothetical protein
MKTTALKFDLAKNAFRAILFALASNLGSGSIDVFRSKAYTVASGPVSIL